MSAFQFLFDANAQSPIFLVSCQFMTITLRRREPCYLLFSSKWVSEVDFYHTIKAAKKYRQVLQVVLSFGWWLCRMWDNQFWRAILEC